MSSVIQFVKSSQDFEAYLSKNKYVVANFTATWCGPCQQVKPIIDALYTDETNERIEIVRVDLDSHGDLASQYQVTSIPTFVFMESGKEVNRVTGANVPEFMKQFHSMKEKAASDEVATKRVGNGASSASVSTSAWKDIADKIPKGFEILNGSIYFGQFEALNALPLYKGEKDSDVKNLFRLDYTKETSTVLSDADSQLLFYIPFTNISKVSSIVLKLRKDNKIASDVELELDEDDLKNECQNPSLIKVWLNQHSIMSFDDASADTNAPHIEKIAESNDEIWYECKLKFVRFQNVQSLNILIDGDDEDYHTLLDKVIFIGVNGESKEQAKILKLDDE